HVKKPNRALDFCKCPRGLWPLRQESAAERVGPAAQACVSYLFERSKTLANATLSQRFRAVAGEDPGAHSMIMDALEKPAGEEQMDYDQGSAPPKVGSRDGASGDNRSQFLEDVGWWQQLCDHLHPMRQRRRRVEDTDKRRD